MSVLERFITPVSRVYHLRESDRRVSLCGRAPTAGWGLIAWDTLTPGQKEFYGICESCRRHAKHTFKEGW